MENSDSDAPTLLKMPEDVMRKILEKVDYFDVASLRKTCHDLRNFIDDVKPDPCVHNLSIFVTPDEIIFLVVFSNSERPLRVKYCKDQISNTTESTKEVFSKDRNHVDVFIDDFRIFLKFSESQTVPMHFMHFYCRHTHDSFFDKIKKFRSVLKVTSLSITASTESEACVILNLATPGVLKTIQLENPSSHYMLQIAEIPRMEQWRLAEDVRIDRFDVWSPEPFLHLRKVEAYFLDLSPEYAVLMKETFLASTNFESFKFHYSRLEDGVFDAIGQYPTIDDYDDYGPKRSWCFRIPGNLEKALLIESTEGDNLLCYTSVNLSDVPSDVEILD